MPIGWPFDQQQVCVVNDDLVPVPPGESGELCLGGSQVTRGYLNDPERTTKSFVRLKHTGEQVWYRTGDLVLQDERACVFYIGRRDFQVKINGYRVNLLEIDFSIARGSPYRIGSRDTMAAVGRIGIRNCGGPVGIGSRT